MAIEWAANGGEQKNLPTLPPRVPSRANTPNARTRTNTGVSNRREAAAAAASATTRPMTSPDNARRHRRSAGAGSGALTPEPGSVTIPPPREASTDDPRPRDMPERPASVAGSSRDDKKREEAFDAFCRSAQPFSMRRRDDMLLLKRIGDKFYSYGSSSVRMRETFRKLDADKSGELSYSELRTGLKMMNFGLTDTEFARLSQTIDVDRSGTVDYGELMDIMETFQPLGNEQTDKEDNMLTAAPWDTIRGPYKLFNKPVTHTRAGHPGDSVEDGSYEQQAADKHLMDIIANKFHQKESMLRMIFRRFDEDKNGKISKQEFVKGMDKLNMGLSKAELERFMDLIDTDNSGAIEYEEFMDVFDRDTPLERTYGPGSRATSRTGTTRSLTPAVVSDAEIARINAFPAVKELKEKVYRSANRARSVFKQLDANGDGMLAPAEIRRGVLTLCPAMPASQLDSIVAAADRNGDGYVSYREFMDFFERDPAMERQRSTLFGDSPIPLGPRSSAGTTTVMSRQGSRVGTSMSPSPAPMAHSAWGSRAGRGSASPASTAGRRSRDLAASRASSSLGGMSPTRRVGRFAYTPEPKDTSALISQAEGTPGHLTNYDRFRAKTATPIDVEMLGEDRKRRTQRADAKRQRAASRAQIIASRAENDMANFDRKEESRLEHKSNVQRRYIERCRLYERAFQPTHDASNTQTLMAAKGWQNFFHKGQL